MPAPRGGSTRYGGTIRIKGGSVLDPGNGRRGEIGDVCIEDGRVVASLPSGAPVFEARGLLVLPGGVDLHSHIAGPAVQAARWLCPESAGGPLPTLGETGRRYGRMGYTTVFDAAISPLLARLAHDELDSLPIVDKGIFLLMGNDDLALDLARGGRHDDLCSLVGWLLSAARGYAPKLVNAGGAAAWKRGQKEGEPDLDLLAAFAAAGNALRLPHPLHVHLGGLGRPGNAATTLRQMDALREGRAHFTHLQFHAYGGRTPAGLRSRAPDIAAWLDAHPRATADVGQVVFGPAVTISADASAQHRLHRLTGRKWLNLDVESGDGCGVVPHEYREDRLVSAVQWATGLELMLLCSDPWRMFLTTDHPNGGSFASYPVIIKMLMDRSFRETILKAAHPRLKERCALASIAREYTLEEIAIVTRAGPARALGLSRKGHLGPGADGDVAVYRTPGDPADSFAEAVAVFKDGVQVVRDGEIVAEPSGRTFFVEPPSAGRAGAEGPPTALRDRLEAGHATPWEDVLLDEETLARPEAIRLESA
jgi:formylmethanofuran dehydrogenase subunit A